MAGVTGQTGRAARRGEVLQKQIDADAEADADADAVVPEARPGARSLKETTHFGTPRARKEQRGSRAVLLL
jgi:hypothetical protein